MVTERLPGASVIIAIAQMAVVALQLKLRVLLRCRLFGLAAAVFGAAALGSFVFFGALLGLAGLAQIDDLGHVYFGPIMSSGRTILSKSAALT